MQETLATLYPYIVLLYILDCLVYVDKDQLLFISPWVGVARLVRRGIRFLGLLPVNEIFSAADLNLFPTPSGIYLLEDEKQGEMLNPSPSSYRFIPYGNIECLRSEGDRLRLGPDIVVKTPSSRYAKHLADRVSRLIQSDPSERYDLIDDDMNHAMDITRIAELHCDLEKSIRNLKILSALWFALLFVLLPVFLYHITGPRYIIEIIFALVGILYAGTILYTGYLLGNTHGGHPGIKTDILLPIALNPAAGMHAPGYLAKDRLARFDPAALAAHLLPQTSFFRLMRTELYRAHAAIRIRDDFGWHEYWRIRLAALKALLKNMDRSEADVNAQPERWDPDAASYCPVCLTEYRSGFVLCSDCRILLNVYTQ